MTGYSGFIHAQNAMALGNSMIANRAPISLAVLAMNTTTLTTVSGSLDFVPVAAALFIHASELAPDYLARGYIENKEVG